MRVTWNRFCLGGISLLVFLMVGCASVGNSERAEIPTSSDMTEVQRRASIRMQLAVGYYQEQQWNIALDEVKQVLAIEPNNVDAHNVRAMIYMQMGENQLAEDSFKRALSLSPNNPDLANNYGWFLCQNGLEAQSISYFEAASRNRSYQSPEKALNNAGVCSLKLGDDKAAEQYFSQAFRHAPSNSVTNANMAKLYYTRGEYERARFYLNRIGKLDAMTADMLWTAIKIERKRGNRDAEAVYVAHLRRMYPNSHEFANYQRGAFDE